MSNPTEAVAQEICSFFRQLQNGQIQKMYRRVNGHEQQRDLPALVSHRPVRDINRLFVWALVNEHDRRRLA